MSQGAWSSPSSRSAASRSSWEFRRGRLLALFLAPIQGTLAMAVLLVAHGVELGGVAPALRLAAEATAGALTYVAVLYRLEPAWCREAAATVGLGRARLGQVERDVA